MAMRRTRQRRSTCRGQRPMAVTWSPRLRRAQLVPSAQNACCTLCTATSCARPTSTRPCSTTWNACVTGGRIPRVRFARLRAARSFSSPSPISRYPRTAASSPRGSQTASRSLKTCRHLPRAWRESTRPRRVIGRRVAVSTCVTCQVRCISRWRARANAASSGMAQVVRHVAG